MNIEITKEETKTLIELLTISGYIMTQVSEQSIAKAEQMHELIQKIYKEAEKNEGFEACFEYDDEAKMRFPNAKIMAEGEDSPLYLLKSYNEFAAADVLSQHLGITDASQEIEIDSTQLKDQPSPEFLKLFAKKRDEYLEEFAEHGFSRVQVNKVALS